MAQVTPYLFLGPPLNQQMKTKCMLVLAKSLSRGGELLLHMGSILDVSQMCNSGIIPHWSDMLADLFVFDLDVVLRVIA